MLHLPYLSRCLLVGVVLLGFVAPALAQTGRISGRITDEEGNPIPGATVRAENPSASPPMREMTTDDDGRFSMIGFISGQWRVSASAEGYTENFGMVNVTQSATPNVELELPKVRHALVQALGEEAMEGLDPDEVEAELEAADAAFNSRDWPTAIAGYLRNLNRILLESKSLFATRTVHRESA